MNIYLKWGWIVVLNAILGLYFGGVNRSYIHLAGMIAGISTWYFAYLHVDCYLQDRGRIQISRKLVLSAILRIPLQFTVIPDMVAGVAAVTTVDFLGLGKFEFFSAYMATLFTGLYLSLLCFVIYGLITMIDNIKGSLQHSQ